MFFQTVAFCGLVSLAVAHGSHDSTREPGSSWAEYHMAEEHHVSNFDAPSFFTLHDFNGDGVWTPEEVRGFYGLDDESLKDTPADVKDKGIVASAWFELHTDFVQRFWMSSESSIPRRPAELPENLSSKSPGPASSYLTLVWGLDTTVMMNTSTKFTISKSITTRTHRLKI